jgi:antitoxin component YwqK of YwqJK toxin-antitoxin module
VIALAVALAALGAAPALDCPPGTEHRGARPPEGNEEWCEGKDPAGGPRREGPARTTYDDGRTWIEERFREGLRDGAFVEWHRNGVKAREGAFTRGLKSGRWTIWWESGNVEEESEWRDGVPHGEFAAYWPTGKRRTVGRHCGGAQCGTWRTYDETGKEIGRVDYGEQSLAP